MKLYKYISIALALSLCACDAIQDENDFVYENLTADQLQVTATPVVVNGKNTNDIVVDNRSPLLGQWHLVQISGETTVSAIAHDTIVASKTGPNKLLFRGHDAALNKFIEKELTIQVDIVSNIPTDIATRLCVGQDGAPDYFGAEIDYSKIQINVEKDADGHNGNRIRVINSNPVLTSWDFGGATSDKNIAELYILNLGEAPLKATFTKADGTTEVHEFDPVLVETFTYKPEFLINLTGGDKGEMTWTWAADPKPKYGIGGYGTDKLPAWQAFDLATLGYFAMAVGRGDEVNGGTMTFKITGELELSSGRKGTYSFDLDAGVPGWSIGKIYTHGVSVLYGMGFNVTTYIGPEVTAYDIIICSDGSLMLATPTDDRNEGYNAATFWCFESVE